MPDQHRGGWRAVVAVGAVAALLIPRTRKAEAKGPALVPATA
jgi:hypothetical protein